MDTGIKTPDAINDQNREYSPYTKLLIMNSVPMQKKLNASNISPDKPVPLKNLKTDSKNTKHTIIKRRVRIGNARSKNHLDFTACSKRYNINLC